MMKNTRSNEIKSAAPTALKTPDEYFSHSPLILSSNTPNESKERTWADIVRTPLTPSNNARASEFKSGDFDLNDHDAIKTQETGSPRSRSDSGHSFQSLQTIIGDVGFNTQVLLIIDPEKRENQVSLYFTSLRSKTVLGTAQGHHVISHRLVLEFCSKVALNSKLIEIPTKIKAAFESVISNIQDLGAGSGPSYPNVPDPESYPKCDEKMSKFLEEQLGVDHREAYETGMRQKRVTKVVGYLSDILTYYNAMIDVTHARSEGGGINQGLEHSTIVALKAISHFLALDKRAISADQKQEFYRQAVEENGEFVDGMIRIFGKGISGVRKDFRDAEKEDRFFNAFNQHANNSKLVGGVIEGLFDFSKVKGRRENKLTLMSKRCIEMSLVAFPELQVLDKKEITEGFLEKVSINQQWNLKLKSINRIAQQIFKSNSEAKSTISISRK